jgi:hypothetical protein
MSAVEASVFRHPSSTVDQVVLNADGSFGGELATELGSKLNIAGGKILQIVRATDTTLRQTTSTSFVDASISVTITPQKNDSAILVLSVSSAQAGANNSMGIQITDNSNNALSGAEQMFIGVTATNASETHSVVVLGRDTPATTNATTYKLRFRVGSGGTASLNVNSNTGQLYAIEVSA